MPATIKKNWSLEEEIDGRLHDLGYGRLTTAEAEMRRRYPLLDELYEMACGWDKLTAEESTALEHVAIGIQERLAREAGLI